MKIKDLDNIGVVANISLEIDVTDLKEIITRKLGPDAEFSFEDLSELVKNNLRGRDKDLLSADYVSVKTIDKCLTEEFLDKSITEIYSKIREDRKEGYIVFFDGESLKRQKIESFISQGVPGVLYDLNRLDEVMITFARHNEYVSSYYRLVNDLAMNTLLEFLYNNQKQ